MTGEIKVKLKAVLFDLDGTLLPMDQEKFTEGYFGLLAKRFAPRGYEPKALISAVWAGTKAMVKNDGSRTNYDAFWETFSGIFGEKTHEDMDSFTEFYKTDFLLTKSLCGYNDKAGEIVKRLKASGIRVILATNPIFPMIATEARIAWTGLSPEDFEFITAYENSSYAKPNPKYYEEVLEKCGLSPDECLMVGNDAVEDLAAAKIGMDVFLLTDCLIKPGELDISAVASGDFDSLLAYLEKRI